MAGRVFVAGSANVDLVATVSRLPRAGETVLASGLDSLPGGKGLNQAVAAAKAGSQVTYFGCVGNDAFGDQLVAVLAAVEVDLSHLERTARPTGTALISVDADGQNQIAIFPGANSALRFCDGLQHATLGDVLLCQNECPLEVIFEYFKAARRAQVTSILNAAPVVDLPHGLLESVDVLVVNEEEARQYCSQLRAGALKSGDAITIAKQLRVRGDQIVILTLGANGVVAYVGDRFVRLPGHKVIAVDTTGAGDCFCGYLASGFANGQSIDEAITLANAAAALAVQRKGAAIAMPDRAEVQEFLGTRR